MNTAKNSVVNAVNAVNATTNNMTKTTGGKIMYVIIVAIIVIFMLYLFLSIRRNFLDYETGSPWIVLNTIDARQNPQFPIPGSRFPPSVDGKFGMEFTYSFWIFIKGFDTRSPTDSLTDLKHIMHKGTKLPNTSQPALQCPGFWLNGYSNSMYIYLNTFDEQKAAPSSVERIVINNLPVKKWFNVITTVINRDVDIYINGRLKERKKLDGLPRQNYGEVYVVQNGGFDGFLSRARYYSEALPYYRIETIMQDGPSQLPIAELGEMPPYLADDYWLTNSDS